MIRISTDELERLLDVFIRIKSDTDNIVGKTTMLRNEMLNDPEFTANPKSEEIINSMDYVVNQLNVLNEDITNSEKFDFENNAHNTKEKLVTPEYKPGSKSVYNENANRNVTIAPEDKYDFLWTVSITEPAELTAAVLHDDYGTASKNHYFIVDDTHPVTVTAGNTTVTINSADDWNAKISEGIIVENTETKTFDIDLIKLFGVSSFPANTRFNVKYYTQTTGDTVAAEGNYHNKATWSFDGTIGPKDNEPGGEASTTLHTTEYNDGTKASYYNEKRLYGGQFTADEGSVLNYTATIVQNYPVSSITYTDNWNNGSELVYPITVTDSNGNTIVKFISATQAVDKNDNPLGITVSDWLTVSGNEFTLKLVRKVNEQSILPDGSTAFTPGVTYRIGYGLDFAGLANENGDYAAGEAVTNTGHWNTTGSLPEHNDDHTTTDDPVSPPWKDVDKSVLSVSYANSAVDPAIAETELETGGDTVWYCDDYTSGDPSSEIGRAHV